MSKTNITSATTFERSEKKYLLTQQQYDLLKLRLKGRMLSDEYGRHTICTLYYDTEDFAVIRRCREKPNFRTKLRLRSYGVPTQESTVYLELKKKFAGITYKRRVALPFRQAQEYLLYGVLPDNSSEQIFQEIDWFVQQQPLDAKVLLCYDRIALYGVEDPSLRITFDANVRWRDYNLELTRGDHGSLLLPSSCRLMEIKTLNALPYWLSEILTELKIYPVSYSKYGSVYENYLAEKEVMRHAG